jgi:signal transduction histidine kinase
VPTRTEVTVEPGRLRPTRPIRFVLVAPAAVMLLGAAITLPLLLVGSSELERRAETAAALRAEVLARAVGARLSAAAVPERPALLDGSMARTSAFALLIDEHGRAVHQSAGAPARLGALAPALVRESGQLRARERTTRFAVVALAGPTPMRLAVLLPVPPTAGAKARLMTSLGTFAALLLAAAGVVAWAMARDVDADVQYLRRLIAGMAAEDGPSTMKPIPVRTIDQVGQLTASFNQLLERFQAAERAYRQDLTQADAYDQDRAAFLSALSHELRTPLNAILGFTDVLLSEIDGPLSEDARENLTIVRTSGEHLRSLIDDILALSALESGQFRLSREQLDVSSVAADVVAELNVTARQKGIRLELARPSEKPAEVMAHVDRRRVRQILQNLVSNAVKFTQVGTVTIEVVAEDAEVVITVADTGPGIAPGELEKIWNEFEQAGGGNVRNQGTGLGLSITQRLARMHGGSVEATSEVGVGSTFTVRLPREEPRARSMADFVPQQDEPLIRDA